MSPKLKRKQAKLEAKRKEREARHKPGVELSQKCSHGRLFGCLGTLGASVPSRNGLAQPKEDSRVRKTIWDDFIYYIPKTNQIVIRSRDCAWNGVWEHFHHDGTETWWTKKPAPKHWILIDRLPEGSL